MTSVALGVLRRFGLLAVPVVLLPWFIFEMDVALVLIPLGLIVLAIALVPGVLISIGAAIWTHLQHVKNERVRSDSGDTEPPSLPPDYSGIPAPLKPGPVLVGANAKRLPTEKDAATG